MVARTGKLAHVGFGAVNLVSAALIGLGVFVGLPTRYWVIDVPAVVVIVLLGMAGGGLLARSAWGAPVARIASVVTLILGLVLVSLLAITASYLQGIYGPVGRGGALILRGYPKSEYCANIQQSRILPHFHRGFPNGCSNAQTISDRPNRRTMGRLAAADASSQARRTSA